MSDRIIGQHVDRLYQRLPAIYRLLDAEQNHALRALLRIISEQINVVEDDIAEQYENWFIETAADWAVPYLGDLIGYRPAVDTVPEQAAASDDAVSLARVLTPRREVANTIAYRRRKGTLTLLEELADAVAGWPSFAVEFYRRLGWHQNINHPHEERARLCDMRDMASLDRIGGPFDRSARTVDIRRVNSNRQGGLHNIPSVGVFVWRLRPYSVTRTPAHCAEENGAHCFTFSILGNDVPLFSKPARANAGGGSHEQLSRPMPIRRRDLGDHIDEHYGEDRSITIWADGWRGFAGDRPIPTSAIIPADLSDWFYVPPPDRIAVDPVLGRLAFPPGQLPRRGVRVSYHYGFSTDIGGGEYSRDLTGPPTRPTAADTWDTPVDQVARIYRVGRNHAYRRLHDAISTWRHDKPRDAVIEIMDSAVYVEPIALTVPHKATLTLRAASGVRPVIRLLDWQTDLPDALSITMGHGSQVALDGLLITGRGVTVYGPDRAIVPPSGAPLCDARLTIRHCTLVPGWAVDSAGEADRPGEASLELNELHAAVSIEHSIIGSILVREDEVHSDPVDLSLTDSILDATPGGETAIGGLEGRSAHAALTIKRCTIFGIVQAHAVLLAENTIFNDCLHVARRQVGCIRYCYVPSGCRTPRRYACQPDLATQAIAAVDPAARASLTTVERIRLSPVFNARRFGRPEYCQLADTCAVEIRQGAHDGSEMGAFHNLHQPMRSAALTVRLSEFTPAGMDAGLINVT